MDTVCQGQSWNDFNAVMVVLVGGLSVTGSVGLVRGGAKGGTARGTVEGVMAWCVVVQASAR